MSFGLMHPELNEFVKCKNSQMNRSEIVAPTGLRVGVDGDALRLPLSGVGHYIHQLCRELEQLLPQARFFAYSRLNASKLSLPSARWTLRQEPIKLLRRLPSFFWLRTRGASLCKKDALDVFWAGRTLHPNLGADVRTVVTVHDLNHLIVPETMQWSTRISHRVWFDQDVASADVVLANSFGTAKRIKQLLDLQPDAIVVPGLSSRFKPLPTMARTENLAALKNLGVDPPYLLSVATLEPRKNVPVLLRAFVRLKQERKLATELKLVLVGAKGWSDRGLDREIEAAKELGVVIAGYIPDELMPALYGCAEALICPSLYEGFGMPVLEARACGITTVVADVPELLESGGINAIVVEPTLAGLSEGILKIFGHVLRKEPDLLSNYDWSASARIVAARLIG